MVPIRLSTRGDVLSNGGAVGEGDGDGEGEGEGDGDGEGEGKRDGEGDGEGEGERDGEGEGELLGTVAIELVGSRSVKEEDRSKEDSAAVGTGVLMMTFDVIGGATGEVDRRVKLASEVVGRADETTGDEKAVVFMTTGDKKVVIFMTTVVVKAMVTQV